MIYPSVVLLNIFIKIQMMEYKLYLFNFRLHQAGRNCKYMGGQDRIWNYPEKLEIWPEKNGLRFIRDKFKILYLGRNNQL